MPVPVVLPDAGLTREAPLPPLPAEDVPAGAVLVALPVPMTRAPAVERGERRTGPPATAPAPLPSAVALLAGLLLVALTPPMATLPVLVFAAGLVDADADADDAARPPLAVLKPPPPPPAAAPTGERLVADALALAGSAGDALPSARELLVRITPPPLAAAAGEVAALPVPVPVPRATEPVEEDEDEDDGPEERAAADAEADTDALAGDVLDDRPAAVAPVFAVPVPAGPVAAAGRGPDDAPIGLVRAAAPVPVPVPLVPVPDRMGLVVRATEGAAFLAGPLAVAVLPDGRTAAALAAVALGPAPLALAAAPVPPVTAALAAASCSSLGSDTPGQSGWAALKEAMAAACMRFRSSVHPHAAARASTPSSQSPPKNTSR